MPSCSHYLKAMSPVGRAAPGSGIPPAKPMKLFGGLFPIWRAKETLLAESKSQNCKVDQGVVASGPWHRGCPVPAGGP